MAGYGSPEVLKLGVDVSRGAFNITDRVLENFGVAVRVDPEVGQGRTFYINATTGSDVASRDGSVHYPWATMTYALSKCVADRGDTIVLLGNVAQTVTGAAVAINVRGVTIRSTNAIGNPWSPVLGWCHRTDNGGPFAIVTQPCRLIGLKFTTVSTDSCLTFDADLGAYSGSYNLISHCLFLDLATATIGLKMLGGTCNRIQHCRFAGMTAAGIEVGSGVNACAGNEVVGCVFETCGNGIRHGVDPGTGAYDPPTTFVYQGNVFSNVTVPIQTSAGSGEGIIAGNWIEAAAGGGGVSDLANTAALVAATMEPIGNYFRDA